MPDKYSTIQQHEPLRVPSPWGQQERRFVVQLEEILDDLYRRFNRLRLTDFTPKVQEEIQSAIEEGGKVSVLTHDVNGLKHEMYDNDGSVSTLSNTVDGLNSTVQAVDGRVSTLSNTVDGLTSDVEDAEGNISTLSNTVSGLSSSVTDATGRISTLENTASGLTTRVQNAEGDISSLEQTASGLGTRLTNAEGDVSTLQQTASSLSLQVSGKSTNFTQWAQPTGKDGDIWDKNSGIRTWAELGELTWEEASAYPWWAFMGSKQYVCRSGAWELMTDEVSLREATAQILLEQARILLSVAEKYGMQSGIEILPAGIEVSGGKYVKIKSGGLFTVESGNFGVDENGNVEMTGTVNAGAGSVLGGWTLGANRLSSGSGTDYVAMDSDTSGTYAMWAGNDAAASAPFRVTRAGKVYLTSLATVDEQGNETIINLSNRNSSYPLWKLNYATIKNISVANNTLTIETTAGTINFSKAVRVATSAGDIDVGSLGPDPGGLQDHVTIYYDDGQHTANVPIVVAGTQTLYSRGAASVGVRSWSVDKSAMPTVTVTVTLTNGEVRSHSFNV